MRAAVLQVAMRFGVGVGGVGVTPPLDLWVLVLHTVRLTQTGRENRFKRTCPVALAHTTRPCGARSPAAVNGVPPLSAGSVAPAQASIASSTARPESGNAGGAGIG